MSNQHSKCDDCYKSHLPENHDRTILPSEAFSEGYVPEFNQASEEREGDAPISDKEAWLRIFEATRAAVHATNIAIINTNDAFDAMKNKLEAEL